MDFNPYDSQQLTALMLGTAAMMAALLNSSPLAYLRNPQMNQSQRQQPNDFLTQHMAINMNVNLQEIFRGGEDSRLPA